MYVYVKHPHTRVRRLHDTEFYHLQCCIVVRAYPFPLLLLWSGRGESLRE